jgi:hypothetical protein
MKRQEKYLGDIATMIVGRQYYKFKIGCMEKIIIEQSPACERKFGKDVIEVKNQDGHGVGHLAARDAAYLKPLIDRGIIHVGGHTFYEDKDNAMTAYLLVNLIKDGKSFLKPRKVIDAESALHNHVLSIYDNRERLPVSAIEKLGNYYNLVINGKDIYPETKLLFHLSLWKAYMDIELVPLMHKLSKKNENKEATAEDNFLGQ